MKIAVIHEWLVTYAGSERILERILRLFPAAQVFTLVDFLPPSERHILCGRRPNVSFIQHLPFSRSLFRNYLPLMPLAIEQHDLSDFDIVISINHAVAKGVITGPDQLHVSIVCSPIRYAWDLQHQYLKEAGLVNSVKGWVIRWVLSKIRQWDVRTSNGVDEFVAISQFIRRRINKVYRRNSTVIYPPVDVESFSFFPHKETYYLTASRMVPYKKIPLIARAFSSLPGRKLVVVGDGPEFEKTKKNAGPNVEILGYKDTAVLKNCMQKARAFIFAAEEDFGITPIEAQACGTPVISYVRGAAQETIRGLGEPRPTGVFFYKQSEEAIADAVKEFEERQNEITPINCRENAERFSSANFERDFQAFVSKKWAEFIQERPHLNMQHE